MEPPWNPGRFSAADVAAKGLVVRLPGSQHEAAYDVDDPEEADCADSEPECGPGRSIHSTIVAAPAAERRSSDSAGAPRDQASSEPEGLPQ